MRLTPRVASALGGLAIIVAACGSGTTASPSGGGAASQPASAAASAAASSAATAAPSTPAASPSSGGNAGGASACALLTPSEAVGVVGGDALTPKETPGDPSYCIYSTASGTPVVATSYIRTGAGQTFDIWKASSGVQAVDGLGDGAVFDPSSATLFVKKGNSLIGIAAGSGSDDNDKRLGWSKALAAIAVARM